MARSFTLIFGPALIVGLSFLLTRPCVSGPERNADTQSDPQKPPAAPQTAAGPLPAPSGGLALLSACQRKREALARRLNHELTTIVRSPFVLAGDLPAAEIDRHYRETIVPTARALAIGFFDKPPNEPITVILLSGDEAYQSFAERMDGHTRAAFAGYYERADRRIMLNIATGDGTIAHELTHALAHFDFPTMPEWFDEGLASVFEQARFSEDGLSIWGVSNWRLHYLIPPLRKRTLPRLESLVSAARVRPDQQAIDYAHARYFCLYLQERGLLGAYYRKFRARSCVDPTGLLTLHELFGVTDLTGVDDEFRAWAIALERPAPRSKSKPAASALD